MRDCKRRDPSWLMQGHRRDWRFDENIFPGRQVVDAGMSEFCDERPDLDLHLALLALSPILGDWSYHTSVFQDCSK